MEGLGKKFHDARVARGLTLDEASRMTKIRPGRLAEIEAEDFSDFPSLAYAKGFLLIYGKFLEVDVTPYLEAFETPEQVTVDGYSYLQDNPAPKPRRTQVVAREAAPRGSLLPFFIGAGVLIGGFLLMKLLLDIQRIKPRPENKATVTNVTPSPTATSAQNAVIAPRALPADGTPPEVATATSTPAATAMPTVQPTIAAGTPAASAAPTVATTPTVTAAPTEPEVRRAEPVHPEDLVETSSSASPSASASAGPSRIEIRAKKKTYIKVTVDDEEPVKEWITPTQAAVKFSGKKISISVLDADDVEIRKNGKKISKSDGSVTIER